MKNNNTLSIAFAALLLIGTAGLTSCEKGDYKCTCVDVNEDISQQVDMSGPKKDMEAACAEKEGVGDNKTCTLTEK